MKKIIDTQTTEDADIFGETLREYCFDTKEGELGCYSCFKLRDGFVELRDGPVWKKIISALGIEACIEEMEQAEVYCIGNLAIGWHWDGDGCLVVVEGQRMAVNGDCKKTYGWEWV